VPPRFFAPTLDLAQPAVTLPASESLHLARVLRLGPGAIVEVFDGRGAMVRGTVLQATPSSSLVAVDGVTAAQPEAPWPLTVCAPLLKGDAMDAVVRDATVLGATQIVPVTTARTNVPVSRADSGRLHERWHRVAVAAAKQCGRATLPEISDVRGLSDMLQAPAWQEWQRRLLVEPALDVTLTHDPLRRAPLVLAFGPEGGWDAGEVRAACEAGWTPWSLGPFTLRAEQVTLAALAVVRYAWTEP